MEPTKLYVHTEGTFLSFFAIQAYANVIFSPLRPTGPMRTSSTNYEKALLRAREQSSISSDISTATTTTDVSFPSEVRKASISITPGQGVVPVIPEGGVSAGQTEALKRQRPRGLSLAELGRKQSWSEQVCII